MKYYITLSDREDGILEILSQRELKNQNALGKSPTILGEKRSRRQAFLMVRDLVDQMYSETGEINVDTYFDS